MFLEKCFIQFIVSWIRTPQMVTVEIDGWRHFIWCVAANQGTTRTMPFLYCCCWCQMPRLLRRRGRGLRFNRPIRFHWMIYPTILTRQQNSVMPKINGRIGNVRFHSTNMLNEVLSQFIFRAQRLLSRTFATWTEFSMTNISLAILVIWEQGETHAMANVSSQGTWWWAQIWTNSPSVGWLWNGGKGQGNLPFYWLISYNDKNCE